MEFKLKLVFSLFLAVAAWQDLREKAVDIWLYISAALCIVMIYGLTGNTDFWRNMLTGLLTGFCLLLLSRITGGAVGSGDGLFFAVSGLCLGFSQNLVLFMGGLLLCGLTSVCLCFRAFLTGRDIRKDAVPFLPFLVPVWIGMVCL